MAAVKYVRRPLFGKTILIVEDDLLVGNDMRVFLEAAGTAVVGTVADIGDACTVACERSLEGGGAGRPHVGRDRGPGRRVGVSAG